MKTEHNLRELLQEIEQHCQTGDRKSLEKALRFLMANRQRFYQDSQTACLEEGFSDSLYKILLLELDEEEEDSIETAELAYIGFCTVLNRETSSPLPYKSRLLLLHYFSDYFTDAVIEIFLKKYREDHMLEARKIAMECLEKMQWADLFSLEENFPAVLDEDEQITEACNSIEIPDDLSDQERAEAELLHKVLYAYLKAKYKKQNGN